jgi:hypothetical protein
MPNAKVRDISGRQHNQTSLIATGRFGGPTQVAACDFDVIGVSNDRIVPIST